MEHEYEFGDESGGELLYHVPKNLAYSSQREEVQNIVFNSQLPGINQLDVLPSARSRIYSRTSLRNHCCETFPGAACCDG
jgi:hypothetical protein